MTRFAIGAIVALGSLALSIAVAASQRRTEIRYHLEAVPAAFAGRFSADQIAVLEALNRADEIHLPRLKTILVPDEWHSDLLLYSPFPKQHAGWQSMAPKSLVVDQPGQAFAAYEYGRLVRWGPVSTGREAHQTPAGVFHLNWRSPGRTSTVNADWFLRWSFNFANFRGLSFHEYALPGRPASHACVRLLERDARWLFDWGQGWTLDGTEQNVLSRGTPVLIMGCYPFRDAPQWRSIEWLAHGIDVPAAEAVRTTPCETEPDPVRDPTTS